MNTAAVIAAAIGGFCLAWGIFLAFWRGYQLGLHTDTSFPQRGLQREATYTAPARPAQTAPKGQRGIILIHRYRKRIAVIGATAALGVGAFAFAGWVAEGTGVGPFSGKVADAPTQVALTVTASTATPVLPGSAGDLAGHVVNDSDYPVTLTKAELFLGSANVLSGCGDISSYITPNAANGGVYKTITPSVLVPAHGSADVTLPSAIQMDASLPQSFAGCSFTVKTQVASAGVTLP